MIDQLKRVAAPDKTIYQLQGELGGIYQEANEKVLAYAVRIKEIVNKILDFHKMSNSRQVDTSFENSLARDITDCFLHGLKAESESRFSRQRAFIETIDTATEIERRLSATKVLREHRKFKTTQEVEYQSNDNDRSLFKTGKKHGPSKQQ